MSRMDYVDNRDAQDAARDWYIERQEEEAAKKFLRRFVARGWLHGTRDDKMEQAAVDFGLFRRWLRREMSEVHFTPRGRTALNS